MYSFTAAVVYMSLNAFWSKKTSVTAKKLIKFMTIFAPKNIDVVPYLYWSY